MKFHYTKNGVLHFGKGEFFIQGVIVLSLVVMSLETFTSIQARGGNLLKKIEMATLSLFCVEYVFRLVCSRDRKKFAFGFYGIIDLLAILPFFLGFGPQFQTFRGLRLLRLFRLLKVAKYNKALERLLLSFRIVREELILFATASAIVIYLLALGIYYFENPQQPEVFRNIFDGVWWSVCTLTTVGYGDAYPVTVAGKVFTMMILLMGLGIVAVPTGLITSALSRIRAEDGYEKP